MSKASSKLVKTLAVMAVSVTTANVNSVCWLWGYQPKMPEGATKLKK